jgi:hypothetical protein
MKKTFYIFLFFTFFCQAQISKKDLLIGGNASFGYISNSISQNSNQLYFGLNPYLSYFVKDKLAIGTSINLGFNHVFESKNTYYYIGIGPTIKYYFLAKEKTLNIFTTATYHINSNNNFDNTTHNMNIGLGSVFFFNKNLSLETGLYYNYASFNNINAYQHNVFFGAGFQIHIDRSSK